MSHGPANQWDERYRDGDPAAAAPAYVLEQFAHLLPARGDALDLAAGLGGNALLLARSGLSTRAWDSSKTAMEKLRRYATQQELPLIAEVRDVIASPPAPSSFDVIVVAHFLDRSLVPALIAALKPGGMLYYQTFTLEKCHEGGPSNPDYLLGPNELLRLCSSLHVLAYREEGCGGDPSQGFRNRAFLVGEKRP